MSEQQQQTPPEAPPDTSSKLPRRKLADVVADLVARQDQQDSHILALHRMVDQLIDELNALREEVGLSEWQPDLHAEVHDAVIVADRSSRARRTDRFLPERPS